MKKISGIFILHYIFLASCIDNQPKISIPENFNPIKYTSSFTNYLGQLVWIPPVVDMGTNSKLVGTFVSNGNYYPSISTSGNLITFSGNVEMKNEYYLVTKIVHQAFTTEAFEDFSGYNAAYHFNAGEKISFVWNTDVLLPWFERPPFIGNVAPLVPGDTVSILKFAVNDGIKELPLTDSKTSFKIQKFDSATGQVTDTFFSSIATPSIPARSIKALHQKAVYAGPGNYIILVELDVNNVLPKSEKGNTVTTDSILNFIEVW